MVDAVRRIGREQVDGAIASAEGDGDPANRVHDIRKRMKKLRGLIRLVRPAFPDYATENARFRDAARGVSGLRDAQVMLGTFDRLVEMHAEALDGGAFAGFRDELAGRLRETPDLAPAAETLRHARERVERWTLREIGWDAIAGGLGQTYRRARKGQAGRSDAELHDWRKRVKDHWYHARLVRDIWPEEMAARIEAADALGECLGEHQDLAVLGRRLRKSALSEGSRRVLSGLVDRRKAETEAAARELAPRLFADKPKALVARWGELWEAWRG